MNCDLYLFLIFTYILDYIQYILYYISEYFVDFFDLHNNTYEMLQNKQYYLNLKQSNNFGI